MKRLREDGLPEDTSFTPQYVTATATTGHSYTRKEIEDEIIYHAIQVAESRWWNRGKRMHYLKIWVSELTNLMK